MSQNQQRRLQPLARTNTLSAPGQEAFALHALVDFGDFHRAIRRRIGQARLRKTGQPQRAGVAAAAGRAGRVGIVATVRQAVVDAQLACRGG